MSYRDVIGWQKAMDLAVEVYEHCAKFPATERYGIVQQLERAVVSIFANVAEGYGRGTKRDYAHHVDIALGSTREVQSLLELAARLGFSDSANIVEHAEEVAKILFGLSRKLKES